LTGSDVADSSSLIETTKIILPQVSEDYGVFAYLREKLLLPPAVAISYSTLRSKAIAEDGEP